MRRKINNPFRSRHKKKPRSLKARLFRFVSLTVILAILMSSFNFIFDKNQPKAHAQTFTTSGTWTVPAGMNSATFEAWGSGGAGAGTASSGTSGGGGGGGDYAEKLAAVSPGDIYTVTVAGVTAGIAGVCGIIGSSSSVADPSSTTIVLATGGGGGGCGSNGGCGSARGNNTGSTIFIGGCGSSGSLSSSVAGAGGGGAGSTADAGSASGTTPGTGSSLNGGNGGAAGSNSNGGAGSNYGGGGGGASQATGASKAGGDGAQGLVIITASSASITSTIRQEINILDGTLAVSSTSSAIVQLDTARYSGTLSYYFEVVTGSSSASTDSVTLTRSGTSTNDASISLAGTAANTRVRSTAFTPPASTQTQYVVKSGANHSIKAARIIVVQSGYPVPSTETQIEIGNQETGKVNTTAAALTSPKYWKYDSSKWDQTSGFYAEVTKTQSATNFNTTITLQQDDASFGTWTNIATIVSADTTTAAARFRVSFTPITGRHYRISSVESASSGGKNYSIYNAKIVVDQAIGNNWASVGSTSSSFASCFGGVAMGALTSSRMVCVESASPYSIQAFDFNGSNWSTVGSAFSIAGANSPAITVLSSTQIAYVDGDASTTGNPGNQQLRTYTFNGSTWSQTGNSLTISGLDGPALAKLSSTRVALIDGQVGGTGIKNLSTYDFNGTNWSQTGSGLNISTSQLPTITGLSSTNVALSNRGDGTLRTYSFSGSTWSQTGNSFSAGGIQGLSTLSSSVVLGSGQFSATNFTKTYSFDGTNWTIAASIFSSSVTFTSTTALSSTRFVGDAGGALTTYETSNPSELESQYLLANTVGASTGLQGYPTKWDSSEWFGVTNTYENVIDSTNASSSAKLQDIDNANTDVTSSTATGNNQVFSSAMTMPASGHQIDANITASATTVTSDRIDAFVTITGAISGSNSAPSTPTLTAPSSGATGVSTTPTFTFNDTDPDSDDIQFKINLFQSDCTTTVSMTPSGDMASGQTGWATTFNGTAGSGLTYTSSTAGSGVSFTPTTALSAGTTYCWSVSAKDPGGSNTSTTSSTQLFTTASAGPTTDQQMRGGVYFSGGSKQPIYWAQ